MAKLRRDTSESLDKNEKDPLLPSEIAVPTNSYTHSHHEDNILLLHNSNADDNDDGGDVIVLRNGPRRFAYASLAIVALAVIVMFISVIILGNHDVEKSFVLQRRVKSKSSSKKRRKECKDEDYTKTTLKTAFELPFAALFKDTQGQNVFEASSVIIVDDYVYAVCDNSWAISRFHSSLTPFSSKNTMIGKPNRVADEQSGYEAIFYDNEIFYVIRESVKHDDDTYHAVIEELSLGKDDYDVLAECSAEFTFEGKSKGFEGALGLRDANDDLVILGLCEGNFCSEENKFDAGNGKVVAMRKITADDGTCSWATIKVIDIPSSADFRDYSAIAMTGNGRIAITSQEDSEVWIGQLMLTDNGRFDADTTMFDDMVGEVYSFPKSESCHTVYCNIEGIHFINDMMLMGVSDQMKANGKQDYRCFDKDQSIHAFVLP